MSRILTLMLLVIGLSACIKLGSDPQPSHYYLLAADDSLSPISAPALRPLGLGPLELPAYLDRPQLVSRGRANDILLAQQERWSEPLLDNISRVLKENLSRQLPQLRISASPWKTAAAPGWQLSLTINQFDGRLGDAAVVDIRWTLFDLEQRRELKKGRFLDQRLIGHSYPALVAALNASLNSFSRQLAEALLSP